MTATTFTPHAPLVAATAAKGAPEKGAASLFGRVVAAYWLWADAFAEARAIARDAHERLPFAEW